jgi:serine O-acetyltransferase
MQDEPSKNDGMSAETADWSRERPRRFWDPARKLIKTLRDYHRLGDGGGPLTVLRRGFIVIRHRFWSVVTASDVPLRFNPAGGLVFPHPTGIVIHPKAVVGPNCMIMQQVTIGSPGGEKKGVATIGGHVDIGAGAKIIGKVTIGDHAQIGANAVVLTDVPAHGRAVGVPARVIAPEAPIDN